MKVFKTSPSAGLHNLNPNITGTQTIGAITALVLKRMCDQRLYPYAIDFSLISLWYGPTKTAIGYLPQQLEDSGMVLMFALHSVDRKTKVPAPQGNALRNVVITGGRKKFCSLYISATELAKCGSMLLGPQLNLLYNLVGATTKNLMHSRELEPAVRPDDYHVVARHARAVAQFEQLCDHLAIGNWVYSKFWWQEFSYLLCRSLPQDFAGYWTAYLADVYLLALPTQQRTMISDVLIHSYRAGMQMWCAMIKSNDVPTLMPFNLTTFVLALMRFQGNPAEETLWSEYERAAQQFLTKVVEATSQSPELRTAIGGSLAPVPEAMVYGVSNNDVATFVQLVGVAYESN